MAMISQIKTKKNAKLLVKCLRAHYTKIVLNFVEISTISRSAHLGEERIAGGHYCQKQSYITFTRMSVGHLNNQMD